MSNIYKSMCETCLKYAGYHSPFDDNDAVLREDAFRFVLKPHIAPNPAEHHIATRARNGTMHRKAPDVTKRRRCNGQTEEQRGGGNESVLEPPQRRVWCNQSRQSMSVLCVKHNCFQCTSDTTISNTRRDPGCLV